MKKNIIAPVALAAAGLLLLSACAGAAEEESASVAEEATTSEETTEAAAELSGTVLLDGSSTVGPFAEAAAELFMNENPGVAVTVGISGTGGGFEKFCNGETDGSNASRGIKDEEAALCADNGIDFGQITVANDALSVIVNQDNPLQCISVESLKALWELDSSVTTWGDIPGIDSGDLASEDVVLYGPGTDSGTFDFFTDEINGESGNIRTDYNNIGEDDNQAVQGVSGSLGAMAFIPYSYYQENLDNVKALEVDGGAGCIAPTLENVQNLSYAPLGRGLFTYFSNTALARAEVLAFAEYLVNETTLINTTAGYVGLTPAQQEEALAKIASLVG